jgi:hypothetical protein
LWNAIPAERQRSGLFGSGSKEDSMIVEAVVDQRYDPESIFYKVRAEDGNLYVLRRQTLTPDGTRDLVSFRQTREQR